MRVKWFDVQTSNWNIELNKYETNLVKTWSEMNTQIDERFRPRRTENFLKDCQAIEAILGLVRIHLQSLQYVPELVILLGKHSIVK